MSKRVLLVSYSQTGQLARLCAAFGRGLRDGGAEVEEVVLQAAEPFPFPWPFARFFDAFPETVHLRPAPIVPPVLRHERYDLVVVAYTVWFLSPSQPVCAFLQSPQARQVLQGTPVATIIGCRNMWLMAQEQVKMLLADAGAELVGNLVKTDRCTTAASFVTTPLWLLTGKRKAASWLPEAGIADEEIADVARFGAKTAQVLQQGRPDAAMWRGMGAVRVNERLIFSERFARRSFRLWGALLMAAGRRSLRLRWVLLYVYIVFLVAVILTVVPLAAVLKRVFAPVLRARIRREKAYYAAPSGE
ncbi:hypothetical protein [Conchiformibius kuhniae]|uniref:Dialkylresorcinol condensing enzyme n=1 Tax=Conchiformibius kuhniae TaxID=211502 RepID=A0ABD8B791_9NEIS|nr:hypothetical protein [Conchiformibius kuhniae]